MADSNRVENPRAFPRSGSFGAEGMTLRDYFAGQALKAYISESPDCTIDEIADDAYRIADAMLIARQTPDTSR